MLSIEVLMTDRAIQSLETESSSTGTRGACRGKSEKAAEAERASCEPAAPHHDDHVTRLSPEAFEAFREQLETGETDPQVLEARERLVKLKPVWNE